MVGISFYPFLSSHCLPHPRPLFVHLLHLSPALYPDGIPDPSLNLPAFPLSDSFPYTTAVALRHSFNYRPFMFPFSFSFLFFLLFRSVFPFSFTFLFFFSLLFFFYSHRYFFSFPVLLPVLLPAFLLPFSCSFLYCSSVFLLTAFFFLHVLLSVLCQAAFINRQSTPIVHIDNYCYLYYSTLFIPFTALCYILHLSDTLKTGHFENKPFIHSFIRIILLYTTSVYVNSHSYSKYCIIFKVQMMLTERTTGSMPSYLMRN